MLFIISKISPLLAYSILHVYSLFFLFSNGSQDRFTVQANSEENRSRYDSIEVEGDCSWEIFSNDGDYLFAETDNLIEIPTNFYIYEITAVNW